MRDPKDDVLSIQLSNYHSLDLVRLPKSRRYRVVLAERFGVQRRAFVELSYEEAMHVAKFLASIETEMRPYDPSDAPTSPGRPSNMPPAQVIEMMPRPSVEPIPELILADSRTEAVSRELRQEIRDRDKDPDKG
jgi:hypothetical protein